MKKFVVYESLYENRKFKQQICNQSENDDIPEDPLSN